jgi:23S rRNA pseudouridine1911/1915/1917 synthase
MWKVGDSESGARLDRFLADSGRLGSRGRATTALQRGKVFVNDIEAPPDAGGRRLAAGDRVRVWIDRPGSAKRRAVRRAGPGEAQIVYEDDVLIVVNKPPGLLAVPLPRRDKAASVQEQLTDHLRSSGKRRRPFVVHRIDRDTSGLVVFATRADARALLRDQFRRHEPERIYLAVVYGHPTPPSGIWRDQVVWDAKALIQKETHPRDPRGHEARSQYRVVERFADASLVEVQLITGKRNQIRLQARLRGHTLVGEQRYVYGPDALRTVEFPRQALHAWKLAFKHPVTGHAMRFEAPLPDDLSSLLSRLRRGNRNPGEVV